MKATLLLPLLCFSILIAARAQPNVLPREKMRAARASGTRGPLQPPKVRGPPKVKPNATIARIEEEPNVAVAVAEPEPIPIAVNEKLDPLTLTKVNKKYKKPIKWRVAFIGRSKNAFQYGSYKMRAIDMAAAFKDAAFGGCDIRGQFDIYVHVKYACYNLLKRRSAAHILDVIDGREIDDFYPGSIDGIILSTVPDLDMNCMQRAPVCARIPHHINHNCTARNSSWPLRSFDGKIVVGLVGSMNYSYVLDDLRDRLPGYSIVTETSVQGGLCEFYDSISIGVIWTIPPDAPQNFAEIGTRKPPTRLVNTVSMNIPVIATSNMAAYHHYLGAENFLCDNLDCVSKKIDDVVKGGLQDEYATLKDSVEKDVSWQNIMSRYTRLFTEVIKHQNCPPSVKIL